jgi:tRNA A37 threonylcarbamoyltransferase TsaD
MWVLGVDTSCDDTGVGLVQDGQVVVNLVQSQTLHEAYGGVVPELASREHLKVLLRLTQEALRRAGIGPKDLDLIAATRGPGLIGALLVGYTFAKGLAWALTRPFYAIHHLEGHIAAAWPEGLKPPFLALVASGGTPTSTRSWTWGATASSGPPGDDAAGEAFDKVARLLGLGFPGGPEIERLAQGGGGACPLSPSPQGPGGVRVQLLRPQDQGPAACGKGPSQAGARPGLPGGGHRPPGPGGPEGGRDTGHRVLLVAGGVAANQALQARFKEAGLEVHFPPKGLSQDNGAMIALAAWRRFQAGFPPSPLSLGATAYWPLEAP